jgi:peroxidase
VAADVALNSPPPGATIADIIALFANKFNLTAKDVAVLSGTLLSCCCCFFFLQIHF